AERRQRQLAAASATEAERVARRGAVEGGAGLVVGKDPRANAAHGTGNRARATAADGDVAIARFAGLLEHHLGALLRHLGADEAERAGLRGPGAVRVFREWKSAFFQDARESWQALAARRA